MHRPTSFFAQLFNPHHLNIHRYHHSAYPVSSAIVSVLDSCGSLQCLKQIHASIIVSDGQEPAFAVASKLISLYVQSNDFGGSVAVLKAMKEPETYLWNSVIKSHVNSGLTGSAFLVFRLMRERGVSCDGYTFPIIIKLVVSLECGVSFAEMIHCLGLKMGFESDVYFCNTVLDAYVKSGCFGNGLKVFEEMPSRDLVSWTSMISGYVHEGKAIGALGLFNEMRKEVEPNEVTMIVMLQTCFNLVEGRQFHGYVIKCGSLIDRSLKNSILKMYADFSTTDDTEILFQESCARDVVSWNIMIYSYSSEGNSTKIVDCFNKMRDEVEASIETFTLLISSIGECGDHSQCRQVHCLALKSGIFDNILVTSLLDSYAKTGDLENSTKLFIEFSYRNYSNWDTMISGYIKNGYFEQAFELFEQILGSTVKPQTETLRSLIVACMHMGSLRLGKALHSYFIRNFDEAARSLETSLLNMYMRCGDISSARNCFDRIPVKDLVTWSSMIDGCGTHGLGHEALRVFHRMKAEGIEPNGVTFLALLSACSHSGLLQEGCEILNSMKREFGIEPNLDHYTSIVDLLGRCGKIKEALSVVLKLVASPDSRIWSALLAACRIHEERRVGEYAAEKLLESEGDNAGYYTLFSNVQACGERWDEVEQVRNAMREMNLIKYPGWSCLEVNGVSHGFVSGDRLHNQIDDLYAVIECLSRNALDM